MKKSIKVTEFVYRRLQQEQRPRETFSDVIERVLEIHTSVKELLSNIEEAHGYQAQKNIEEAADATKDIDS